MWKSETSEINVRRFKKEFSFFNWKTIIKKITLNWGHILTLNWGHSWEKINREND